MTAREVVLLTLSACDTEGAWSDVALKKHLRTAQLDSRDAALATKICFGVLQHRILIDFYIQNLSNIPLDKLENKVLNAMRLAAYQMIFLSKIPVSAAVYESVELARKYGKNPRSTAVVNGILRGLGRILEELPEPTANSLAEELSIEFSHPVWLVQQFLGLFGEIETRLLLEADNSEPATVAQVNTTLTTTAEVVASLTEKGVTVDIHPWLSDCLTLSGTGDLERLSEFQDGQVYIQDVGARLAVIAASVQPEMKVLDTCAAPGGKSFATAIAMGDKGSITSCDIHSHKIKLIKQGAKRLHLESVQALEQDAKHVCLDFINQFDLVITDVPCSGLGIIRKKPDIRYKEEKPLERLPEIQLAILKTASTYVKEGGALLYCTCTILQRENKDVIDTFLKDHSEFELESFELPEIGTVASGELTLLPHVHDTDGFYIAKLRKKTH